MLSTYAQIVEDSTPGRFEGEGPMTAYVYEEYAMNGDDGDEFAGDSDYGWANLYGRRILWGSSSGFISLSTYATKDEARKVFDEFAEPFYAMDDDES